MIELFAVF